jgi:hypothetical protein
VRNLADLKRLKLLGETIAPHLGGASQAWTVLVGCVGRTAAPVVNPPHRTRVTGTPRLLLVSSTHDPSTPYVWAQQLASEIRRSVLLTRKGDGTHELPGARPEPHAGRHRSVSRHRRDATRRTPCSTTER